MKKEAPKKALNVVLDESLIREIKAAAGISGKTMAVYISESMRTANAALAKKTKAAS